MQQREKKLALIVGVLAAMVVGWFVYDGVMGAFAKRQEQLAAVQKQLQAKEAKRALEIKQRQQLKELDRKSLPSDRQLAKSLYENWLVKLMDEAGLTNTSSKSPTSVTSARDGFEKYSFAIGGRGTAENITKFLYEFYRGDHLHKIHNLTLTPSDNPKYLSMSLTVEALSLTGVERSDRLNGGVASRLAEQDLGKYKEAIAGRNLFAPYVPPKPPERPVVKVDPPKVDPPPKPPEFDAAKFAKVTSIMASKSGPEVWLLVQTTGKRLTLREGDSFEVGTVRGQVTRIGYNSMEFSSEGHRRTVTVGNSLREATEATEATAGPMD